MSASPSPDQSHQSVSDFSERPNSSIARLQIRVTVERHQLAHVTAEITRLVARLLPNIPHLLLVDGDMITLRARHRDITVLRADILACRLSRIRGIFQIRAEKRVSRRGTVYAARLRGRSWSDQHRAGQRQSGR